VAKLDLLQLDQLVTIFQTLQHLPSQQVLLLEVRRGPRVLEDMVLEVQGIRLLLLLTVAQLVLLGFLVELDGEVLERRPWGPRLLRLHHSMELLQEHGPVRLGIDKMKIKEVGGNMTFKTQEKI
jgi:hypothetical protein